MTGIFNDSFPPIIDGVTLTVQNYARVLNCRDFSPCVVTPWNPEKYATDYPVMRYLSLPIPNRRPYRYGYPKLDPFIWRKLRNTPFRLVHSHSPFSAGRLAAYTARKQNIPLVATFHSKYRSDLEHALSRYPRMVDSIMKNIISFFESCDHVWIPQAAVEATVREYGFRGPLSVVENGNDLASLHSEDELPAVKLQARREIGIPDEAVSLLFVGQHILDKGIDVIAHTLCRLAPDTDFRMHFIGTGYALGRLREFVAAKGLGGKVTVHGPISDRPTLCRHYAAADLFLFPSFYDNAPLVVREAAAMMTPTILLRGSTAAEVITDGENGFLCDKSADDYAALIRRLHSNPDALRRAALGARRTLTRTWDDVLDEVIYRYHDITNSYKRR